MRNEMRTAFKSLMVASITLAAAGCGSKTGTYTLSQSGNSYYSQCSSVTLNLTDSSNNVSATGSNGVCQEQLTGTDSGSSIIVSSFTVSLLNTYTTSSPQCVYTGTLITSGNTFSGTLTTASTTSLNYSYCTPITVTGTKN